MIQIYTEKAPKPVGPYSQAVAVNGFLFISGQIGIDPSTGKLKESFEEQVLQILKNVEEILKEAGTSKENVVRVVIYMTDLSLFGKLNAIYEEFFKSVPVKPARTTVGVSSLPLGAMVEMEITAKL